MLFKPCLAYHTNAGGLKSRRRRCTSGTCPKQARLLLAPINEQALRNPHLDSKLECSVHLPILVHGMVAGNHHPWAKASLLVSLLQISLQPAQHVSKPSAWQHVHLVQHRHETAYHHNPTGQQSQRHGSAQTRIQLAQRTCSSGAPGNPVSVSIEMKWTGPLQVGRLMTMRRQHAISNVLVEGVPHV